MASPDGEGGGPTAIVLWIYIRGSSSLPKQQKRRSLELHVHQEDRPTINTLGDWNKAVLEVIVFKNWGR